MYEHILKTQQSFARKAKAQPEHRFTDLYHLICREEWLRQALMHVLSNKGAKTPGVDGISKKDLETEAAQTDFVLALQHDLKTRTYQPYPVQRQWIPKPGKTEKRGLGIPTVRDRVVQELLRMLMEPIWESDFLDCSNGFRPGRRTMDCISVFYSHVTTNNRFFWAIEGDIRQCFDRVHHCILMKLLRQRIGDARILKLAHAFLKAGVLDKGLFLKTPEGTPQGGILSPLLANIYLHQLDLWWWKNYGSLSTAEKQKRRRHKQGNAILTRYADDFVILWNGTKAGAYALRDELRAFFWNELRLELSEEKTHVTHMQDGLDFLGFHLQWKLPWRDYGPWLRVTPTQQNIQRFRNKVRALTRRNDAFTVLPEQKFKALNRYLRGWGYYYNHVSFKHNAYKLDFWVNKRVLIWLRHYHQKRGVRWILKRYKLREKDRWRDRWNFAVESSQDGRLIFIFRMSGIRLKRYLHKKQANPYLKATEILGIPEPETPFAEVSHFTLPPKARQLHKERGKAFKRDHYRCVRCGKVNTKLHAHHEQARSQGGTHKMSNLTTLCETCHRQTDSYGRNVLRK